MDISNAAPLYLAGAAHGAMQLMALAHYRMAMDIAEAEKYVLLTLILI